MLFFSYCELVYETNRCNRDSRLPTSDDWLNDSSIGWHGLCPKQNWTTTGLLPRSCVYNFIHFVVTVTAFNESLDRFA